MRITGHASVRNSCSGRKRFRQIDRPRVQRLPDDDALDAVGVVRARARMSSRPATPPLAMTLRPLARARAGGRGHVDAGQHAVARDVGEDDPQHAQVGHAPRHGQRRRAPTSPASRASPPCRRARRCRRRSARRRSGRRPAATSSGCCTATVPSTTRVAPNSRARATSSNVRMPPPNWIGRSTAARISARRWRLRLRLRLRFRPTVVRATGWSAGLDLDPKTPRPG